MSLLEESDTHFILDGLVRVDIFNNHGQLVVNEFEGIDACVFSTDLSKEGVVEDRMQKYWETKILECITLLFAD